MRADVVDRDDVRMTETGRRSRFQGEAGKALRVAGEPRRQDFQRDAAIQVRIVPPINLAHPAASDQVLHLIATELRSGRNAHDTPINEARRVNRTDAPSTAVRLAVRPGSDSRSDLGQTATRTRCSVRRRAAL